MLTFKRMGFAAVVAGFAVVCALASAPANAASTSNEPSAILVWPKIVVNSTGVCEGGVSDGLSCTTGCVGGVCRRTDTLVQIANVSNQPVAAHCFYVNANSHCTNTGAVCLTAQDCVLGNFTGACVPGWNELNFDVRITQNQPLVWSALEGLARDDLPCGGTIFDPCSGNQGTRVPPVPEDPFIGELKCIQVDANSADRLPAVCAGGACPNDLIGEATIQGVGVGIGAVDPQEYSALGIQNVGSNDGNGNLVLDGAEYATCPNVLIFDFLFDGATDPISGEFTASSELTLVPCSEDLLAQIVTPVTAQFLVFNEFEQRFSTSRQVNCFLNSPISLIDTSQSGRSIFSAGVGGTVAGQARIQGVDGGLLGVATLSLSDPFDTSGLSASAGGAYNLNQIGDRANADLIRIPGR